MAPFRLWRPLSEVSSMYSDSGVVMRTWGGCLAMAWRSAGGVSPVLTAVLISGRGSPRSAASFLMPSSGTERLRWMSLDSAFSGET